MKAKPKRHLTTAEVIRQSLRHTYEVAFICWDDSKALATGWTALDNVHDEAATPCTITSVGLLMESTPEYHVLCMSAGEGSVDFALKIPVHAVKTIKKLGKLTI